MLGGGGVQRKCLSVKEKTTSTWPSTEGLVENPGLVMRHAWDLENLGRKLALRPSDGPITASDVLVAADPLRHMLGHVCSQVERRQRLLLIELLDDRFRLAPSRPVDRQMLYETLHGLPGAPSIVRRRSFRARPPGTVVPVAAALAIVARWFGVSARDLRGRERTRPMDFARLHALSLLRRVTHLSQEQISAQFSHRHHSALVYSERRASEMLDADPGLRRAMDGLASACDRAGLMASAARCAAVLNEGER